MFSLFFGFFQCSYSRVAILTVQLFSLPLFSLSIAEFFINFVSIDRICEYLSLEDEEDPNENAFLNESFKLPIGFELFLNENWPEQGRIEFENFSSTFTECREPVLSGLNLQIEPGSLIAVVGKSGSGKTSLALSLFNAIKRCSGSIRIDNVDIGQVGLQQLRKNLSIFPQEAALFTGTLYFNLDPERQYKDSELWTVLEQVGIKDQILCYPGNLNYKLIEGGKEVSLSQKQLLCLARTLLKKSKVMIIDETGCQFDLDTEIRLRKLYRTTYSDRTILLITKNIENIRVADKVLFLSYDGHCRDFKEPKEIFGEKNCQNQLLDALNNLNLLNNA